MTQGVKDKIIFGSALFMLFFGVALTTAGFVIEPAGQVHDSVLYVLGQCLIFAGSAMGVSAYTSGKFRDMQRYLDHRLRAYERGREDDKGIRDKIDSDVEQENNEEDN